MFPPAHTAPQLMELGKAEAVGVLDGHHGGVGHIHPHLDHGGGHQHLDLAGAEGGGDSFFFLGGLLAVEQAEAHRREGLLQPSV